MRHRDALRLTGGAGSVKDIAKGSVGSTGGGLRRRRIVERAYVVTCRVERDRRDSALYEAHREGTFSNDACRGGVGEDVGDPIRRLIGVQRNIRCARLQQSQQGGVSFEAAVEQNADAVSGLHALRGKMPGHLVGTRIEFAKRVVNGIGGNRDPVCELPAGLLENIFEALPVAPAPRRGALQHRARTKLGRGLLMGGDDVGGTMPVAWLQGRRVEQGLRMGAKIAFHAVDRDAKSQGAQWGRSVAGA